MSRALIAALALSLAGCASPARLPESHPQGESQPLIEARDSSIAVAVDAVVVRNGVGSWMVDAGWDEYRFRFRSISGGELRLEKITLFDALGHPVEPAAERAALLEGAYQVVQRYAASGLPTPSTQQGIGSLPIPPVPPSVAAALLVGAIIIQAANEASIDSQLKDRHTPLPVVIGSKDSTVVAFFPIVLRPAAIELTYLENGIERRMSMATREALRRVRDNRVAHLLQRPEPGILSASAQGLVDGHVKAQLVVDGRGRVTKVDILEYSSTSLVAEARRAFRQYRYTEGAGDRTVEEVMLFKRRLRAS